MKTGLFFLLPVSIAMCLSLRAYASLMDQISSPVFVAHRGAISHFQPENTLDAIQFAVSSGIRQLEIDASISRDGHIIIFHDRNINEENTVAPNPFIGRKVRDLDIAEIRQLRLKPGGKMIPTLDEVIGLLKEFPSTLQIDMKQESFVVISGVVAAFKRAGQISKLIIQFKDLSLLEYTKEKFPEVRTILRVNDPSQFQSALATATDIIELEEWDSQDAIDQIHAHQKKVLINVSASPRDQCASWRSLRNQGVDFILTDDALSAQSHC